VVEPLPNPRLPRTRSALLRPPLSRAVRSQAKEKIRTENPSEPGERILGKQ
jgi:hypothetical protein